MTMLLFIKWPGREEGWLTLSRVFSSIALVGAVLACSDSGPTNLDSAMGQADLTDLVQDLGNKDGPGQGDQGAPDGKPVAPCKSLCDCTQGQICNGGKCINDKVPSYCCTNPGCPAGQLCTFPDLLKKGICRKCTKDADCGKPGCSEVMPDCLQRSLQCDVATSNCRLITATIKDATCDSATGLCKVRPKCKKDTDCGKKTCKALGSDCVQLTPQCNAAIGVCSLASGIIKNATCDSAAGLCKVKQKCTKDSQCGNSSCQTQVVDCMQTTPKCNTSTGVCSLVYTQVKSATCDIFTGLCKKLPPCAKDADCGSPACLAFSTNCLQFTPQCNTGTGLCSASSTVATNSSCSASGLCKSLAQCAKDADCGSPTCAAAGTSCAQKKPLCELKAGKCLLVSMTIQGHTCNASSGLCEKGGVCSKDLDCGKPGCVNSGTGCAQMTPRCDAKKSACGQQWSVAVNASCDSGTGLCKPKGSCLTHCDCPQGMECVKGKCLLPLIPLYCCGKAGCPSGAKCKYANGAAGTC